MQLYRKLAKGWWQSRSKGIMKKINQRILRRQIDQAFKDEERKSNGN